VLPNEFDEFDDVEGAEVLAVVLVAFLDQTKEIGITDSVVSYLSDVLNIHLTGLLSSA
jgi:hypothetical protein